MTKTELLKEVCDALPIYYRTRFGKKGVQRVVDEVFTTIISATLQGEDVRIKNFATFYPMMRAPHMAYSAKGAKTKMSKPYLRIMFKTSVAWKRALAETLKRKKASDDH